MAGEHHVDSSGLEYGHDILPHFDKLMFGSDWPTHRSRSGYAEVLATTLEAAGPMTPAQRDQLFFATAQDFYRIS